ncbi:conserved hypothetical protein [Burkholderia sp. 8Y]|nr:conserved hypothetical protein [Burkholderia sp. 8Y]
MAPSNPAPQYWCATGSGGYAYPAEVLSGAAFFALKRANGELPETNALFGGVAGATLNPLPHLSAPATADDEFDLLGAAESAAGALLGGGDDDSDDGDGDGTNLFDGAEGDDSSGGSTSLYDAQPFKYGDDSSSDDVIIVAARGVSEADEGERYAQYERDMDECSAYRSAMGGQRFMDACSQRAFSDYQQCRGY